jgi:hypothetical protein
MRRWVCGLLALVFAMLAVAIAGAGGRTITDPHANEVGPADRNNEIGLAMPCWPAGMAMTIDR